MENKPPSNFITPESIDNLSIAGVSVWLICLTITSIASNLESFWVRIIAILIALIWSVSLFIKNKRWNKRSNYILVIVNAVLIYVNAAGLNTVTRQSPFEGYGVKASLENSKEKVVKSEFYNLEQQKDWNPDYKVFEYIDSLQVSLNYEKQVSSYLSNDFSYIKDNVNNITDNAKLRDNLKKYLRDFGKSKMDSTSLGILKNEFQKKIDSLIQELRFREANPIVKSEYATYTIDGKEITSSELLVKYVSEVGDLRADNSSLVNLLNYVKGQKTVPVALIDTALHRIKL